MGMRDVVQGIGRSLVVMGLVCGVSAGTRVFAATDATTSAKIAGPLDQKTFTGEIAKKGTQKADKDEFVFKDGTFRSTSCDAYGFSAAAYTAKANGQTVTFEATATSLKEGIMEWKGTAQGATLTGTAIWRRDGKTPEEYAFSAKLKS